MAVFCLIDAAGSSPAERAMRYRYPRPITVALQAPMPSDDARSTEPSAPTRGPAAAAGRRGEPARRSSPGHRPHRRLHRTLKRRLAKLAIALGVAAMTVVVVAIAVVYVVSEAVLARTYEVPLRTLALPGDDAALAEGRRLASLHGCIDGCHSASRATDTAGDMGAPAGWRVTAPGLQRALAGYDDAELVRLIRHGVRRDGRSVFSMPADVHSEISDDDVARIVAFLRHAPPGTIDGDHEGRRQIGLAGRLALVLGEVVPMADVVVHEALQAPERTPVESRALGEYLARTVCATCHGSHGGSAPGRHAPDLALVSAYTPAHFARLLRTGKPIGEQREATTHPIAARQLSRLTDAEIDALDHYLRSRTSARVGSGI
jgi:mono/diheme cytochrome c family protein